MSGEAKHFSRALEFEHEENCRSHCGGGGINLSTNREGKVLKNDARKRT